METASQHLRNEEYYRDLVEQIGEAIGEQAYIADDGVKHDRVLCAKVPELVFDLIHTAGALNAALRVAKQNTLRAIAEQRCERGTPYDAGVMAAYNAVAGDWVRDFTCPNCATVFTQHWLPGDVPECPNCDHRIEEPQPGCDTAAALRDPHP